MGSEAQHRNCMANRSLFRNQRLSPRRAEMEGGGRGVTKGEPQQKPSLSPYQSVSRQGLPTHRGFL